MISDRRTASVVGVLFILATAFSLASSAFLVPILGASDYLSEISTNSNITILGVLLLLAAAISIFLIPAMAFPVLKRANEGAALGYFGFRTIEAMTLVIDGIALLSLVSAAQEYAKAGALNASAFQAWGAMSLSVHNWMFDLNPIVFGLGALLFYSLMFHRSLVPRWLSLWGLAGGVSILVLGFAGIWGLSGLFGPIFILLALPIAVQEQALAIWLILKGFNQPAIVGSALASPPAHA
jgi:NADH:ubiquinone oxidoreductase subunit K